MSRFEIAAAAANLPALIERARAGEEVVLSDDGRAVVRLVPVAAGKAAYAAQPERHDGRAEGLSEPGALPPRQLGLARGKWTIPDDFDAPLPDDILDLFEGRGKFTQASPSPLRDKP